MALEGGKGGELDARGEGLVQKTSWKGADLKVIS